MGDKAWKKRERNVAKYFNGERNALSGGNSKITRADVIHPRLFIECKLRKIHSVVKLWEDTNELAKKEGKTAVVALCQSNRKGSWLVIHSDDLDKIIDERNLAKSSRDS